VVSHPPEVAGAWPPPSPPSELSEIAFRVEGVEGQLLLQIREGVSRALRESGRFSDVRYSPDSGSSATVVVRVEHAGKMTHRAVQVVSAFLLFAIPFWGSDHLQFETSFENIEGAGTYSREGSVTLVVHTILILTTPSALSDPIENITYDALRSSILEAVEGGVL